MSLGKYQNRLSRPLDEDKIDSSGDSNINTEIDNVRSKTRALFFLYLRLGRNSRRRMCTFLMRVVILAMTVIGPDDRVINNRSAKTRCEYVPASVRNRESDLRLVKVLTSIHIVKRSALK